MTVTEVAGLSVKDVTFPQNLHTITVSASPKEATGTVSAVERLLQRLKADKNLNKTVV